MGEEPKLVKRKMNRKSTIMSGRTIGERRERLETKNERIAARKKDKKKKALRVSFTLIGFAILALILIIISAILIHSSQSEPIEVVEEEVVTDYQPTIEIVDENATTESQITNRMRSFIGETETHLRERGYQPSKAVIPSGSIRLVYIYLNGYTGYVKYTIDRDASASAEDTDRLIRYLAGQGTNDFEYLDVRIPGRAFWK